MTELIEVDRLRVDFPIYSPVLRRKIGVTRAVAGASFTIANGQTLGLVGESGCGKSTLARTILRLQRPDSGTIRFAGDDVSALTGRALHEWRRNVQIVLFKLSDFDEMFSISKIEWSSLVTRCRIYHVAIGSDQRELNCIPGNQ